MNHYDKTRVTFHRGNVFSPEGITPEPVATLVINDLVDRDLINAICALVREHVNKVHADHCNIKLNLENWDC